MTEVDDRELVAALVDVETRRGRGEEVDTAAYRDRLGTSYSEFCSLVGVAEVLQDAMDPTFVEEFPRPFGEYTLLGELGRGAMGVVYEAHHEALDRSVALKVLLPELNENTKMRERYRREARSCARVRHDHIVEIYETGEIEGRPYYAMALLEGVPLSALIKHGELRSREDLCHQLAGVADALHAIHEAGVVHRDVKPGNIIVEPGGRMVLADFGLARSPEDVGVTRTGEHLGTPLYMSPEQMVGRPEDVDARTDVYALGGTLYEAVTGLRPFEAERYVEVQKKVLTERPRPPRQLDPSIPRDLERIVLTCLEKEPKDRYPSAATLAADLRAVAHGADVAGRPVSMPRRWTRAVARHPGRAVAALGLVAVLFLLIVTRESLPDTGKVVACTPDGEVSFDGGETYVPTPTTRILEPGVYKVRLRAPGFPQIQPLTLHLRRGETRHLTLLVRQDSSLAGLECLSEGLQLPYVAPEPIPRGRRSAQDPVQLLHPRGAVRLEDVATWRVDVSEDFGFEAAPGRLRFSRDGQELASLPFEPEDWAQTGVVPSAVRNAVGPRDVVTWGFYPEVGEPVLASFEIVDVDLEGDWARVTAIVEDPDVPQPPEAEAYLRAQVYLTHDLNTAALRHLSAAREGGLVNLGLMEMEVEALRRLYAAAGKDVTRTRLWGQLDVHIVAEQR